MRAGLVVIIMSRVISGCKNKQLTLFLALYGPPDIILYFRAADHCFWERDKITARFGLQTSLIHQTSIRTLLRLVEKCLQVGRYCFFCFLHLSTMVSRHREGGVVVAVSFIPASLGHPANEKQVLRSVGIMDTHSRSLRYALKNSRCWSTLIDAAAFIGALVVGV